MIDELEELNNAFFKLYAELHENKKFLGSEEQHKFIAERIFEQYKLEYTRLKLNCEIEEEKETFAINDKRAIYIPYRWRKWSWRRFRFRTQENEAARLISERVQKEAIEYFERCEKALQAPQGGQEVEEAETDGQAEQGEYRPSCAPKTEAVKLSKEEREFIRGMQKKPKKDKEKNKS